jgi:hypothetical protein
MATKLRSIAIRGEPEFKMSEHKVLSGTMVRTEDFTTGINVMKTGRRIKRSDMQTE